MMESDAPVMVYTDSADKVKEIHKINIISSLDAKFGCLMMHDLASILSWCFVIISPTFVLIWCHSQSINGNLTDLHDLNDLVI